MTDGRSPESIDRAAHKSWDIRSAARQYSQIMGALGGFVVPAIILLFTVAPQDRASQSASLSRAAGLLVLALICCLIGAFAFAAIGAERHLTANIGPAGMWVGGPVLIGLVAILAAFETLASIYLPESRPLFATVVIGSAFAGSIFTMLGVSDEVPPTYTPPAGEWLTSHEHARMWSWRLGLVGALIIAFGALSYVTGQRVPLSTGASNWLIGVGILLSLAMALYGVVRAVLTEDGQETALRLWEAIAVQLLGSTYLAFLIVALV